MRISSTWIAVALALILSAAASAQGTTATIYGNVTDSTGAVIWAASVTATNELTGATASTETNSSGDFTFTFLPVGRYRLAVAAQGFKAHQHAGLDRVGKQFLGDLPDPGRTVETMAG